jgi:hypothetical protein
LELLEVQRPATRYVAPSIEATGLARDFIRRAGIEFSATTPTHILLERIIRRATRHPLRKLRPELLVEFGRAYRAQPDKFRLHLDIAIKKSALELFEIRCCLVLFMNIAGMTNTVVSPICLLAICC